MGTLPFEVFVSNALLRASRLFLGIEASTTDALSVIDGVETSSSSESVFGRGAGIFEAGASFGEGGIIAAGVVAI